jgi:hypothetical protein
MMRFMFVDQNMDDSAGVLLVVAILLPQLLAQLRVGLVHRGLAQLTRNDVVVASVGDVGRHGVRPAAAGCTAADTAATAALLTTFALALTLALSALRAALAALLTLALAIALAVLPASALTLTIAVTAITV